MKMLKQFFLTVLFHLIYFNAFAQVKQINLYLPDEDVEKQVDNLLYQVVREPIKNEADIVFHLPLADFRVTSKFGQRTHPVTGKHDFHQGVDLVSNDKIVRNMMKGKVISVGFHKNLGNYVKVDHGYIQTVYGHLAVITVEVKQVLAAGYPIGIIGRTGRVTGEHLHFGVLFNDVNIDPLHFIQQLNKQEY